MFTSICAGIGNLLCMTPFSMIPTWTLIFLIFRYAYDDVLYVV